MLHDDEHIDKRKRTSFREPFGKRLAFELFHDDIRGSIFEISHVVDLTNMGVAEGTDDLSFSLQALGSMDFSTSAFAQNFDGDRASELDLDSLVHDAHPAFAKNSRHNVSVVDDGVFLQACATDRRQTLCACRSQRTRGTTKLNGDSCEQFFPNDRFDQVIVGSRFQSQHLVVDIIHAADDDHGNIGKIRIQLHLAQHMHTIDVR